ncbi:MAG: hypothetical protein BroJett018_21010 [Chloroflexota bacterium]|nr:hypothetical protein [Chloroflexota bacterium]NOG65394.1 hypothetical protein [Chloroflexota bacterium]GIK64307.1 MAG: hypothetical protein BroJett018_21010 [Chloroflexota bacterium]
MSNNEKRQAAQQRNEREGEQISVGNGKTATINPTSDPKHPEGSTYVSVKNADGTKDDATMVVDKDGNILNENPKSSWYEGS